jgi:dTDP-4-amino-4,6-dideoxygalactose transaminase
MINRRIKLSHPYFSESDFKSVFNYLESVNEINPSNEISLFENKLADYNKVSNVVAVSSGTSALHLALLALRIKPGDTILLPTLTFAASAFPIKYLGAIPIFIDVEDSSWVLNIDLVQKYLLNCDQNDLPKAIIAVDLFGRTCDYQRLIDLSNEYKIPIIVDAAESLGSLYQHSPSTTQGLISILSFNFNKIITTTGGGAILTNQKIIADNCRKLANQSRENVHWFEHTEIGYNYRMSPILAALGSAQIDAINEIITERKAIRQRYADNLDSYSGIRIIGDSHWESSNAWLTNVRFSHKKYPNGRDIVREVLEKKNIESRYIWKPLHLQPIFLDSDSMIDGTAEQIYLQSLCLPSGRGLSLSEVDEICESILISLGAI